MSLLKECTKWVLFLPSTNPNTEQRHIMDLAFGLMSLEKLGVESKDISIYIDGADRANINQWIKTGSSNNYNIQTTSEFFPDLEKNKHNNIVMFVTGHGSHNGLDANPVVKPHHLLQKLKKAPELKRAVVYFGQCFAGIFDYMPVSSKKSDLAVSDPNIVFIGATDLHASLSAPTREDFNGKDITWVANLFLLYVFKWIQNPIDIDGDGKYTIMDSYKFSGSLSNLFNRNIKSQNFIDCVGMNAVFLAAEQAYLQSPQDLNAKLHFEGVRENYTNSLSIHFTHQECWILNSIPAQNWEI